MSPGRPPCVLEHLSLPSRPGATPSYPRSHFTLTWAQSLDAKIAGPSGQRVVLSGPESMEMTHWSVAMRTFYLICRMRSMHDAIMVGVNTVILDDPRLQSACSVLGELRGGLMGSPSVTEGAGTEGSSAYYTGPPAPISFERSNAGRVEPMSRDRRRVC